MNRVNWLFKALKWFIVSILITEQTILHHFLDRLKDSFSLEKYSYRMQITCSGGTAL